MIQEPRPATLRKYGLSAAEWMKMLVRQAGVCFVCQREPKTGRLCIDHEHVQGWKKMPPERRKLFVRGLLCWVCNSYYLARGITISKAKNVVHYLELYEKRKQNAKGQEKQAA